jgi:hypothetical protein
MARPYRRRVQKQPATATCAACQDIIALPGQDAEALAAAHAGQTGHEVRISDSRYIYISPKPAAAVTRD